MEIKMITTKLRTLAMIGFTMLASMANAKKNIPWGNWCFEPAIGSYAEGPKAISFWDELTAKKIVFVKNSESGRNSLPSDCLTATRNASSTGYRLCTKWAGSSERAIPAGRQITVNNVKQCYVTQ